MIKMAKDIVCYIFLKIKEGFKFILLSKPLIFNTILVLIGFLYLKLIWQKYGKNCYIFFVRGKTGDFYLFNRYLDSFVDKNNITKFIFLGDGKGMKYIAQLFGRTCDCVEIRYGLADAIQRTYAFIGHENFYMTHSLLWDVDFYFNRDRVRMLDRFSFIDSFKYYLFDLDKEASICETIPKFAQRDIEAYKKLGIEKNNTIIISPYAYCVKWVHHKFWNCLIFELKKLGYHVMVNIAPGEPNPFKAEPIFFSYKDSVPILEYAGFFIGLRSGFCDIISSAKCKKVILYPKKPPIIDYSSHRCDAVFSSMNRMGLSEDDCEISSFFFQDISNHFDFSDDFVVLTDEIHRVIKGIVNYFRKDEQNVNS